MVQTTLKPAFAAVINALLSACRSENKDVRQITLQKYLYFLCGYYYARYDIWPITCNFSTWPLGPVCPRVYKEFRRYGDKIIDFNLLSTDEQISPSIYYTLKEIVKKYKKYDDKKLSDLTHGDDTPWTQTFLNQGHYKVIDKDLIRNHFRDIVGVLPVTAKIIDDPSISSINIQSVKDEYNSLIKDGSLSHT